MNRLKDWIRQHKVWTAVILVVLVLAIAGFAGDPDKKESETTPSTSPAQTEAPMPTRQFTFDVPALIGKNIDEIRQSLGTPKDGAQTEPNSAQLAAGTSEWNNTFEKDGKELLVTFEVDSRKAIDFFISTDDPSGKTKDKNGLLEIGNLSESANNYSIEFVKTIPDPNSYTGVKAIPS